MFSQGTDFNWVLEPWKFLSEEAAKTLLATARRYASSAMAENRKTPVRDYLIVDIGLSTGLKVMEIAQLNCGDIFMREGTLSLLIRCGKEGKRRLVRLGESLEGHSAECMVWKESSGDPVESRDPLLMSNITRQHVTTLTVPGGVDGILHLERRVFLWYDLSIMRSPMIKIHSSFTFLLV